MKRLIQKTTTFVNLDFELKWLAFEVSLTLIYARLMLAFYPFRKIVQHLESTQPSLNTISKKDSVYVKKVRRIIRIVSANFPFEISCYPKALAGKLILKKRKVQSTLYLGARKNEKGNMTGHAWLTCANIIVTGKNGHEDYIVMTSYT